MLDVKIALTDNFLKTSKAKFALSVHVAITARLRTKSRALNVHVANMANNQNLKLKQKAVKNVRKADTVTTTVTATQHLLFFHVKLAMQANGAAQKVRIKRVYVLTAMWENIPLRQQQLQLMHVSIALEVNS